MQVRPHTVTVRVKQRPAGPPEPVTNLATTWSFHTWWLPASLPARSTFFLTNYSWCHKLFPTWNSMPIIKILPAVILLTFLSSSWTKV